MPNSQELGKEREVLEDMLRSEGWAVFTQRVADEWTGSGFFSRMGSAVSSDDPIAAKVIYRTSLELQRMIQWPKDRVKHLRGHSE